MSNFVERRKRFLQMMSIKYGFVTAEMDIVSVFEAGLTAPASAQFSLQEAFTSAMSAAAKFHTSQHLGFNLALYFAESATAKTPSVVALVPAELTFDWTDSDTEVRAPMAISLGAASIQMAFSEDCSIKTCTAAELGLASQLSTFSTSVIFQAIAPSIIAADISSSFEANINLVPAPTSQIIVDETQALTIEAELQAPNAPLVEAELPFDLDFSVSMSCIKRMRLSDYATKVLANLSGSLDSLEYITL